MYATGDDIVEAALDLIDEVLDVETPDLMHAHLVRRCTAQPERTAQLLMCLAFWASAVPTSKLTSVVHDVTIERARDRLKAGVGDEAAYIRAVQEADRAKRGAHAS